MEDMPAEEGAVVAVAAVVLEAMVVIATLEQLHHLPQTTPSLSMEATLPLHLKAILRVKLLTVHHPRMVLLHHKVRQKYTYI